MQNMDLLVALNKWTESLDIEDKISLTKSCLELWQFWERQWFRENTEKVCNLLWFVHNTLQSYSKLTSLFKKKSKNL